MAPIIRRATDGERELVMARWGMPGPPQFGGAPIAPKALELQRPLPDDALRIVASGHGKSVGF